MVEAAPGPEPDRSTAVAIRAWIDWFGPARFVTSSVAVVIVTVGGWLLLRTPVPGAESALPRVTSSSVPVTAIATETASATTSVADDDERSPLVLIVHVTGAVAQPGVYRFAPGDRLTDAVSRAGGATEDGNPHDLNLAAPLTDGMRVSVPVDGEVVPIELRADAGVGAPGDGTEVMEPIDLNAATLEELDTLPGVGPSTASAIVTERERNGPFVSVDDLERVPGIGPAKLASLSDLVTT